MYGRECFKCFNATPGEIQTFPERTVIDLSPFPSGCPVLLQWGRTDCRAVDVNSQQMDSYAGGIAIVLKQFLMKSKQFQMELQTIYSNSSLHSPCFYIGQRTDCQAVDFDSQYMVIEAGCMSGISNQFTQ